MDSNCQGPAHYRNFAMKKYIIIGIVAVLGLGFLGLLTIDIPAPKEKVERTIPDDEFPN